MGLYIPDKEAWDDLVERLEATYSFAKDPDFTDVYVGKKGNDGLINPRLYPEQQFVLPWIHDILGFGSSDQILSDPELREKAETVVSMVLKPEYQELQPGYGLVKYKDREYKSGWSVHLPGFDSKPSDVSMSNVLLTLQIMAPFRSARENVWFKQMMNRLEDCLTEHGTYQFH